MNFNDFRDEAIYQATPTIIAPRFGKLPGIERGNSRYIVGSSGFYIEALTGALYARLKLGVIDTPYGEISEEVVLAAGLIPPGIMQDVFSRAANASPAEWAGIVVYDPAAKRYRLIEPPVISSGAGHITYDTSGYDDMLLLMDIHSHHSMKAYFSETDNRSDRYGTYISTVIGGLEGGRFTEAVSRIVVNGKHFYNLAWNPW